MLLIFPNLTLKEFSSKFLINSSLYFSTMIPGRKGKRFTLKVKRFTCYMIHQVFLPLSLAFFSPPFHNATRICLTNMLIQTNNKSTTKRWRKNKSAKTSKNTLSKANLRAPDYCHSAVCYAKRYPDRRPQC